MTTDDTLPTGRPLSGTRSDADLQTPSTGTRRIVTQRDDDLLTPEETKQRWPEVEAALLKELLAWAKLKCIGDETSTIMPSVSLREIRKDGLVADSEMSSRGFVVGAKILKKDDTTYMHTITDLGGSSKSITVQKDVEDEEPAQQAGTFRSRSV